MPPVALALVAAALTASAWAIRAHYLGESARGQVYVAKPLATLLILVLAFVLVPIRDDYRWLVAAGLLFSLAGDVFLMLPRDRFVAGLASFLVAHLFYLAAFSADVPFGAAPFFWPPFFAAGGVVLALVWPGLKPALRAPVAAYVVVIAAMAAQAAGRWSLLGGGAALSAAIGAGLFMASDAVLAINRFRWPFRAGRAINLAAYWAAQLLIAFSVSAG